MPGGNRTTLQRLLTALGRYHARVNHPAYGNRRKRGNEPRIIALMTEFYGGKECRVCGYTEKTQLHHIDGNWKNNQLHNLAFYCKSCHLAAHQHLNTQEQRMKKISDRYQWLLSDAKGQSPADILLAHVENHSSGQITTACRELSANSVEVFGEYFAETQLVNTYYRLRDRNRRIGKTDPSSRAQTVRVTSGTAMSASEAMDFYQFCKKMGIKFT